MTKEFFHQMWRNIDNYKFAIRRNDTAIEEIQSIVDGEANCKRQFGYSFYLKNAKVNWSDIESIEYSELNDHELLISSDHLITGTPEETIAEIKKQSEAIQKALEEDTEKTREYVSRAYQTYLGGQKKKNVSVELINKAWIDKYGDDVEEFTDFEK